MKPGPPSFGFAGVIRRTCITYWPGHLMMALAVALCTAIVAGALIVGDSVRGTLRKAAEWRLGRVQYAWVTGDRLFREDLAMDIRKRLDARHSRGGVTALLSLGGMASSHDEGKRTGGIRVLGVRDSFRLMSVAGFPAVTGETMRISRRLAEVLAVEAGDEVVLRVERPDVLKEMALQSAGRATAACRLRVEGIVEDGELGRFGLENTQVPPLNAFVDLAFLQKLTGAEGQANVLLFSGVDGDEAGAAMRDAWDFPDGGLEWRTADHSGVGELRSRTIFIDDRIAETAGMVSTQYSGVLTYLVTSLKAGEKATPYAFVAGVSAAPDGMKIGRGEMVATDWLAEDLGITAGDEVELRSYSLGDLRAMVETTNRFRVISVVPLAGTADPTLMPFIPGLSDAGSCAEWRTGMPIDFGRVRAKDEAYWEQWRGSPKAFIGLEEARRMWGNRWGSLTAVRCRGTEAEQKQIRDQWRALLAGGVMKPVPRPVRDEATRAGKEALDFGQLFLGLSMFLVVAAVILMALLFGLAGEQRMQQTGVLMAVGFDAVLIRRWAIVESLMTAVPGAILGCLGGVGYARGLLWMLEVRWSGETPLGMEIHVSLISLALAAGVSLVLAVMTSAMVSRRLARMQPRNLMEEVMEEGGERGGRARRAWSVAGVAALGVVGAAVWFSHGGGHEGSVEAFFLQGAGLLVAGFALMRRWIDVWGRETAAPPRGRMELARRNAGRYVKRSFLVSGLTACAVFLLVSVALFEPARDGSIGRKSGTGGYGLMINTTVPLTADFNNKDERRKRGLEGEIFRDVAFTGLRMTGGDDAGCANLNRSQRPRLIGVDPVEFERRDAFRFIKTLSGPVKEAEEGHAWMLLAREWGTGIIPAVADEATLMWGLGKRVGDEIVLEDERGNALRVRFVGMIANSVLQGSVIIPESALTRHFPSEAGVRQMLVDVPRHARKAVADRLSRQLGDDGAEVVDSEERLRQLNAVTVLYIRIFQALGGLGMLLGGVGVAAVVARNGVERRGELALLRAAGFSRGDGVALLAWEQIWLMGLGIATGCLAAAAAVWPLMVAGQGAVWSVWVVPGYGLLAVAGGGVLSAIVAARWVMRGEPWDSLRLE